MRSILLLFCSVTFLGMSSQTFSQMFSQIALASGSVSKSTLHSTSAQNTSSDEALAVFARIQKMYGEAESIRVQFFTRLTADGKQMRGVLLVKRGNKFQLDLAGRVITCNGKAVWNYDKASKKVIVSDFKNSPATMSPEKLFLSFPKTYKPTLIEQSGSSTSSAPKKPALKSPSLVLLTLKPASPKEAVAGMSNVTMLLDPTTLVLRELNVSDDATVYQWTMQSVKLNAGLSDAAFEFVAPKGVQVVDLRD
jgi:outer membrane lipoprotein-sorting protein